MRIRIYSLAMAVVLCLAANAPAQFQKQTSEQGPELGQSKTQRWKCGVSVKAVGGTCSGIRATIPVPVDWPEQTVIISDEDVSSEARVNQGRNVKAVPQMEVRIRRLPSGREAHALLTYEVTRRIQKPPENTDGYKIAKDSDIPRDLRMYLGPSMPHIDCRDERVRKLGDMLGADASTDWERVEAIYDYVREKIELKSGAMKGSIEALEDRTGNHEDLCFAFIAICRAAGIPARTVWVQGHCYPEFYLVDEEGEGHWFPCQVAGPPEFGGISELRPVLQKGDNFRDPFDRRKFHRYLPEKLIGSGGRPKHEFVRELLPDTD